jgi:glycosyltransferase involved in cell wall biosynthesis
MLWFLLLPSITVTLTLINSLTMRVVRESKEVINSSVTILIPMRNEEGNVESILSSVQSQVGLANFSISVLNDHSTDSTLEKLQTYDGIDIVQGTELPAGWLGKNWACHQLAQKSHSELLVFLDADVQLALTAVASAIALMQREELDFLSPHPREIAETFIEKLIQPLLQWSWLSSVLLRFAERARIPSMTIANGQFFIVKSSAYLKSGGHESIKGEVLDDLSLARALVRSHFTGTVADASTVSECRMYKSSSELISGYTKSLWRAFGNPLGALVASLLLIAVGLVPLLLGMSGYAIGFIGYFLTALSFAVASARTQSSKAAIFLHPISITLVIFLIGLSYFRRARGALTWKGRVI